MSIRGCLLELNANNRQNQGYGQFISYGVEEGGIPIRLTVHTFNCQQNTFVNHGGAKKQFLFIRTDASGVKAPAVYSVKDNVIAGLPAPYVQQIVGSEGATYEPSASDNTFIAPANMNAQMPGHARFNFSLATPVKGARNWAARAYKHPNSSVPRSDSFRGGVPA